MHTVTSTRVRSILPRTVFLSAFALGVLASATASGDPSLPPYTYNFDSVAPDSSESEAPQLGAALGTVTDPVQRVIHSVVSVEVNTLEGARTESTFGAVRSGSGVVLDANGLIATVGYIVAEADTVKVTFANGITDDAEVVAYDDSIGVGLLRTKNFRSTIAIELGDSSDIEKDQKVLVLPASGEQGARAVSVGKIKPFTAGWEYVLNDAIHTYPPSAEFSGAALLSDKARLLGIGSLVSIDIDIDPKVRVPGNIFIPIDTLKNVMGELLTKGRSDSSVKPWIGVETKNTKEGIQVGSVYEDGPAAKAGIKTGDKIVAVDQKQVIKVADLYARLWTDSEPGDKIHLLVLRDQQYANVPVETVDRYEWLNLRGDELEDSETKLTEMSE